MSEPGLLRRVPWWVALAAVVVALCGSVFIRSATASDPVFEPLHRKHLIILLVAAASALPLILVPYKNVMRAAWVVYGCSVVALLALPWIGVTVNGARRWFQLPGFQVQPSEPAKLAVILALASYLRFRSRSGPVDGWFVPLLIAAVPAALVMRQPDLGSALVFAPILLAMCWVAGAPARTLFWLLGLTATAVVIGWVWLHDYQRERVDVWLQHFTWDRSDPTQDPDVRTAVRGAAYQPWQALIAIGSAGWTGFGLGEGPQNRYGFLPYRFDDYVFAVVAEETGLLGVCGLLVLQGLLVWGLLLIALRSRERFGRLVAVGVATYFATQTLIHAAVCSWLIPATGLPMPLVSYGGSSAVVSAWGIALTLGVGARRDPVLASDGFA